MPSLTPQPQQITVGARVRLKGLQAKPELNGREGLCKGYRPDTTRWTICLDPDGAEVAIKVPNLDLVQPVAQATKGNTTANVTPSQADTTVKAEKRALTIEEVLAGLDKLLSQLDSTRGSILDAMVYCMEHEAQHATPMTRRLLVALAEPGLSTEAVLARLFVISDVLHNSGCRRGNGGAKFGANLQDLLPEAFEKLGRLWLGNIEGVVERVRGEETVCNLLKIWEDWSIFPTTFAKGLEALLMAPIVDTSAKDAANEPDALLRQKLMQWFSGVNQAQLPYACRMRGLAGKSLSTVACRVRLCHFERYWHLCTGMDVRLHSLQGASYLNGCIGVLQDWQNASGRWNVRLRSGEVKALKRQNLFAEKCEDAVGGEGTAVSSAAPAEPPPDPLDGEPLTAAEWAAVKASLVAEEKARRKSLQGRPDLGGRIHRPKEPKKSSWTQVWDGGSEAPRAVNPADFVPRAEGTWTTVSTDSYQDPDEGSSAFKYFKQRSSISRRFDEGADEDTPTAPSSKRLRSEYSRVNTEENRSVFVEP